MTIIRPWTVLTGDCRETLRNLPENSIDGVVTDTPYGLSTILDPPRLDREALWRKLTSGERESPIKMLMRSWLDTGENPKVKGRGFMGKEWDALVPPPNLWREIWRVLKPGAYLFAFGGTRTYALIEMSLRFADFEIDDGICTWLQGQGMAKRVRLSLKIDEHFEAPEDRKARRAEMKRTRNSIPPRETPEGRVFAGHDRALAPKWEPIIVAVKPLRGKVAENALSYGTGGLHVDACRLPRGGESTLRHNNTMGYGGNVAPFTGGGHEGGGYPANVVIDDAVAEELDRMSGVRKSGQPREDRGTGGIWAAGNGVPCGPQYGDKGGAGRFFYTAKASSSERDAGLEDLAAAGEDSEDGRNPHPTVKPIALMRWLCRLASPPGANDPDEAKRPVILDPFAGSGSTLVAALREGVRVIGCEMDPVGADVARRRCQHAYAIPREEAEVDRGSAPAGTQGSLF